MRVAGEKRLRSFVFGQSGMCWIECRLRGREETGTHAPCVCAVSMLSGAARLEYGLSVYPSMKGSVV